MVSLRWSGQLGIRLYLLAAADFSQAERAAEEKRGLVRWLRPEFQNPSGAKAATQASLVATDGPEEAAATQPTAAAPWPKKLPEQIAAIRDIVTKTQAEWSIE
jgi:hypothetical protein